MYIYIYISPVARSLPAESTCRGGQTSDFHLVEGQTHGLRAVTYLLVRSWIGVTSICGLLTREIDGRRGEIVELFLLLFFPFSLFLYPSRFVMTRRDGSGSVGHSRQFDWAIAVYLSPVRLGQYQFRGIVAWQVFKQLIQDRFLWYIKRSNFSIVGTMNSKSCRPIDQNYYNISFYLHLFVLFSFRLKRSLWLIIYSSFCFLLTPNCLSVK